MKRIFAILIGLVLAAGAMWGQEVSNIEQQGNWVYVYDARGKKACSLSSSSVGTVVGWSSTFWVSYKSNWYYLWTPKGKKYKSISASSVGEVVSVSGGTFTSRKGNWTYTYNSQGKKINSRYSTR